MPQLELPQELPQVRTWDNELLLIHTRPGAATMPETHLSGIAQPRALTATQRSRQVWSEHELAPMGAMALPSVISLLRAK